MHEPHGKRESGHESHETTLQTGVLVGRDGTMLQKGTYRKSARHKHESIPFQR